ncbi:uncharacterized protein LOC5511623 [Nematostella vectensis]|uniref:uncharacterized protein LOC5511623 n=1 Tax=Nematostella vectensis TaxID=45351 RepID=UPI0020776431|nr:uncharacterized protein LOC5511623 [Nematostella vectensis]
MRLSRVLSILVIIISNNHLRSLILTFTFSPRVFNPETSRDEISSHRLLSSRSPSRPSGFSRRSRTAPVSRAKARSLIKQGNLLRANETLAEFNARLQDELYSLKQENIHLTISANEARSAMYHAKNQLSVSIRDREDLRTRINRLTMQNRRLEYALRVRAENEVNTRNLQHKENEQMRWKEIGPIPVYGASNRYHQNKDSTGRRK